ncbi:helix-turn-helix domain-containing protein [Duganella fentianensis]|uniref:helix-turn-helix domain-containing protein n=1 Tax=Duganella fentianensis TaxID=2692177 RepID=UPI0032B1BCEB
MSDTGESMNSEWVDTPQEQAVPSVATPGAQLAAQREALGLTVEQIADQLKLATRQVRALEAGDYEALPNMAVVRGFVRAYAKVVKLDATPLVAMIEVVSPTSYEAAPPRKEAAPKFTESRFPSMTPRPTSPVAWLAGAAAAVALVAGGVYAYQSGIIPLSMFQRSDADGASAVADAAKAAEAAVTPIETTLVKPGEEGSAVQNTNVPLVSVPAPGADAATTAGATAPAATPAAVPATAPATAPVTPPATTAPAAGTAAATTAPAAKVPAGVTPAAAAPAAAPAPSANQLVLKVNEDSWVEIRRPGAASLISRTVKAGSTETFDIKEPALLIIGKPAGVEATLGGNALALPPVAGGTISRVNIK